VNGTKPKLLAGGSHPQDVGGHPIFLRYSNPELGIKFRLTEFAVLLPFGL